MDKKKKFRIVVVVPMVVTVLLVLGLLTMVLILGSQKAHAQDLPQQPDTHPQACDYSSMIGKSVDTGALQATDRPYRILPPGNVKTDDLNPARIDVETDSGGLVTAVTCG